MKLAAKREQEEASARRRACMEEIASVTALTDDDINPAGLEALRTSLADPDLLRGYFTAEAVADGTAREFLDAYAALWNKKRTAP